MKRRLIRGSRPQSTLSPKSPAYSNCEIDKNKFDFIKPNHDEEASPHFIKKDAKNSNSNSNMTLSFGNNTITERLSVQYFQLYMTLTSICELRSKVFERLASI